MKMYHLTSIYHLSAIMSSGYLKIVESNVSLSKEHAGPDVVALTTSPRSGQGWASMTKGFEYVDKCRILFELDLPDEAVHPWYDWALAHGADELDLAALAEAGNERRSERRRDRQGWRSVDVDRQAVAASLDRARAEWFVIERTVPWLEWVSVTDRLAGSVLWRQSTAQQTSGTLAVSKLWLSESLRDTSAQVMVKIEPDGDKRERPWMPTTIVSEENPGAAIQIGGSGPPDITFDTRAVNPAEAREILMEGHERSGPVTPS